MNLLKISSGQTSLKIIFIGFALFVGVIFYFVQQGIVFFNENVATLPEQEQSKLVVGEINFGPPMRLRIPAINVDAAVESLGLTSQGDMDTPKGPDDVAWFNLGTRPGENGSAVIAGHYGTWKNGKGSVFDKLHELKKGDKVYVESEKGEIVSFVVSESRNYEPNADATNVFSSDDEKSHLNLVTCEGIWNKDFKSYSERLVVFTDKEW